PIKHIPESLSNYGLKLSKAGNKLTYHYDATSDGADLTALLQSISDAGLNLKDMQTKQSSLEDIFVDLLAETT
ncbi:MAG: multidrug ABC transporter ATP-binding protein, partial [Ghiorsea sp.]|nr:multidrug ABC transporter ATP-binding protein [Ghiorsea sp.]